MPGQRPSMLVLCRTTSGVCCRKVAYDWRVVHTDLVFKTIMPAPSFSGDPADDADGPGARWPARPERLTLNPCLALGSVLGIYETLSERSDEAHPSKGSIEALCISGGGWISSWRFYSWDSRIRPRQSSVAFNSVDSHTGRSSGRKALYVNPLYTQSVEGLTEAESRGLLDFLFQHVCRPDFTYRHQWTLGDVVHVGQSMRATLRRSRSW